uniref:AB hydrolase-1 domain-containing protein n=1 Tax=Oryza barthii TaxID=65489 RepID=A0A0D3EQ45_9ORYZ
MAPLPAAGAAGRIILAHGACHGGWCWYKVAALLRAAGHRVDAPDLGAAAATATASRLILVHGAGHGGWCWYRIATMLRAAGHRVHAPDLAASGADARRLRDAPTFGDYSRPLLDAVRALPGRRRARRAGGHSFGGMSVALAAETFPDKVAAAVFVAAFLPDCANPPSHPIDTVINSYHDDKITLSFRLIFAMNFCHCQYQESDWMDTVIDPSHAPPSILFGPEFLKKKLYQLSSLEDYTLAKSLVRASSLYVDELRRRAAFREDRYGAVRKVYVVVENDMAIVQEHQRWMVANAEVAEVRVMDAGDHMAMLSAPEELAGHLADVANTYI